MKEALRNEILRTAKVLLQEGKDIRQITMNLIAKRMGITAPTLYHYFKSKEEIIGFSFELIADELLDVFNAPLPPSLPKEMKLQMIVANLMDYLYKNIHTFGYLFTDGTLAHWGSGELKITEKIAKFRDKLEACIKEWLVSEKLKMDSLRATFYLISLMMGELRYHRSEKVKDAKEKGMNIGQDAENVFHFFRGGAKHCC